MSLSQRYKKDGCGTAKDVDFAKILANTKIKVPIMVTAAFSKKVAGATKPFDVLMEFDDSNGKGKLSIKKLASGDAAIEWTDPTVATSQGGVLKVKAAVTSWGITKANAIKDLNVVVAKVNAQKDLIKGIESNLGDPTAVLRIPAIKDALEKAAVEGEAIFSTFNKWYLAGPRKGTGPLLTAYKVEEAKISKTDKEFFNTAVMEISQAGNEVKNLCSVSIEGAVKALLVRLENLKSQMTKSKSAALADIRKSFATEIEALRQECSRMIASVKLDHSVRQGAEFTAKKGDSYDRLKDHPPMIAATIEGNNTRLKTAQINLAEVEKTATRLIKGIPQAFAMDPQIMKLNQDLAKLVSEQNKTIAEAKIALAKANSILDNYMKAGK